ncbi:MAG: RNA methyltransferase [Thermomicrobiales bacterium]
MRHRERAILVEGSRAIQSALDNGVRFRTLFIDASRVSDVDVQLLASLREAAQRVLLIDGPLFQQITESEHPQPLVAICDMLDADLPPDCAFVVALDGVRDPGNLGTLVRTCAAAGADGLALLRGSVDLYNPKAVRASAGAIFAIPARSYAHLDEVITRCFQERPQIVVADSDSETAYDAVNWRVPSLLIIGGEADGVSAEVRTYADLAVRIPMAPGVESLNAAVAGSIIAFEVARQRRLDL